MGRIYKTQSVPTIELTKDLIQKVIRVLETEYDSLLENQDKDDKYYNSKEFSIRRKDKSLLETDDSQKFLENDFDRDIDRIVLKISTKNRSVTVEITTSSWSDSDFSATSADMNNIWVNGIMSTLSQTFNASKNSYGFWHSKKAFLVYFPVALILSTVYYYLTIRSPNADQQLALINWVIWTFGLPFTIRLILQWVFPKVETKQSRQKKFKKIVLSVIGLIGTLVLGITGNYLYDMLK
jgi:hypothetical protein